jgi:hypothetical protein
VNKHGQCTAQFPRNTFLVTAIDRKNSHINVRKREEWVNNVTTAIMYALRCNTDTTSLQSGTAVNSVVRYIMEYFTKAFLKSHQVFSSMYNILTNNAKPEGCGAVSSNHTRKMIVKIVNNLSAKMEMGAPMAAMYLLGNPDHYKNHEFTCFYWQNFVTFVEQQWTKLIDLAGPPMDDDDWFTEGHDYEDVGLAWTEDGTKVDDSDFPSYDTVVFDLFVT